jgi:O-antigen ligase
MIALAGIVAIINPPLMVAAVLFSIPIQESAVVPFVRGELTYTQIALFGLVMGWAVTFYRRRIWLDSIVLGFLAVFAAFSLSLVEMDSISLWAGEVYRWAAAAAFFVICRSVLRSWRDIVPSMWAAIIGVIGVSIHSFWQVATGAGPENFVVGGAVRVFSTFGTPNTLAAYIEFTVPVLVVISLSGFRTSFREMLGRSVWLGSIIASGMGLLTLGLTQSRGGWIGMAVGLIVVFAFLPRKLRLGAMLIGGVFAIVFLLTPAGRSQVDRFAEVFRDDETAISAEHQYALGRGSLWGAAIGMIEDEPLTGIGAGEFDYHYREYTPSWLDRFPRGQAHNGWLQMGAQAGLPGILAFTAWLAASLVALGGAIRRAPNDLARMVSWGALAVMVAFTMHSMVDYLNVLSLSLQLSGITAIGLSLAPESLASRRAGSHENLTAPSYAGTAVVTS